MPDYAPICKSRLPSLPNIAGKAAPDRDRQTVPSKEDPTNSNLSLTRSATATTAHPSPTLTHIAPQSSSATAKSSTPSATWSALAPPRQLLFPSARAGCAGISCIGPYIPWNFSEAHRSPSCRLQCSKGALSPPVHDHHLSVGSQHEISEFDLSSGLHKTDSNP